MTALIKIEHPFGGKVRVAVMSLQTCEVYYEAEPILKAMAFPDYENIFRRLCRDPIRLDDLDESVVVIPASDVRRLISYCFDMAGSEFGRWLLEDGRREALRQAGQLPLL